MSSKIANLLIGFGLVLTVFAAMNKMPNASAAPDMGWGTPTPIQPWQEGDVANPRMAMAPSGVTHVVWQHSDATRWNILANQYNPAFDKWDVPTMVQNGPYDGSIPSVAADGIGNAVAVWDTWDGEKWSIFASVYFIGSNWLPPTRIDDPNLGNSNVPRVAMNDGGNAVAVWTQYDTGSWAVFANVYRLGSGWSGPTKIDPAMGSSDVPQVAVDPSGNAFAVWLEWLGAWRVAASRYTAGSWSPRVFIESSFEDAYPPDLQVDDFGNAISVWRQQSSPYPNVVASRYNISTGWGTETVIDGVDYFLDGNPRLSMNGEGEACAVWSQYDGGAWSIFANEYDPVSDTWGIAYVAEFYGTDSFGPVVAEDDSGNILVVYKNYDPTNNWYNMAISLITPGPVINYYYIEDFKDDATAPQVAFDSAGNAMVVWLQWFDADKRYSLYSMRYYFGSGWWWPPRKVEFDDEGWANYVSLAANTAGAAIAAWTQDDGPVLDAYASSYSPATGWTSSKLLERDNTGDALDTAVGIDDSGNGLVLWRQWNGSNWAIYSSRYLYGIGFTLPDELSGTIGDSLPPQIAMNRVGTAMAAWRTWDGTTKRLYAARYVPGTGWESPVIVDSSVPNDILDPVVAIDDTGDAIIADSIWDGGQYSIYAYNYVAGTGWGPSKQLEFLSNHSLSPRIAMNGIGETVVTWNNLDGADYSVYAVSYTPGSGWHHMMAIETMPGETFAAPVAIDSAGYAYAAWQQWDGVNWNVYVARRQPDGTWYSPMAVVNYPSTTINPNVAVNRNGIAYVYYSEADGDRSKIGYIYSAYARRFNPASGWGPSELLETRDGDAWACDIRVDGAGNALATFLQYDGVRLRPWSNRYVVGDGTPRLTLTSPTVTLTNNPNTLIAGITDPGASVSVNTIPLAVDEYGLFSHPTILSEGLNTYSVMATNLARNTKSVIVSVVLDTIPPNLAITAPSGGSILNTPTVTVTGLTEPGANLIVNGVLVQPAPGGDFTVNLPLVEGPNIIIATAMDEAGNMQMASVAVTLDTVAPALQITSPSVPLTNNPMVTVFGQTEPGATVTINGTAVAVDPFGGFNRSVVLSDAEHKFVVVATDAAGNTATATAQIVVDTAAPNLVVTAPIDGTLTKDPIVSVVGSTEPGASVMVNGIATNPDSSGVFLVRLILSEGLNAIQTVTSDEAGNTASVTVSVTLDTGAPTLQLATPTDNLFTNNPNVLVSGVTDPGANVTIDGVPVAVLPTGDFSQTFVLPEGRHTFDVRATDAAGNVAMAARTVTVDSTPPILTVTSPTQGLTVAIPSARVTGTTEPGATLTVQGQLVLVQSTGDFDVPVALLIAGQNTITISASDKAGNTNTTQRNVVYVPPDIIGMQQNITDLQQRILDLLDVIDKMNGTINDLNNQLDGRINDTNNNITTLQNLLANITQSLGQAQRDLNTVRSDVNSLSNVLMTSMAILIVALFIGLVGMFLALSRKISSLRGPQSDLEEVEEEQIEEEKSAEKTAEEKQNEPDLKGKTPEERKPNN